MIACHRRRVGTGSAAEPDTMRRSRAAPADQRWRVPASACSHASIRRRYSVGTAMKSVTLPLPSRSQMVLGSGGQNSQVAPLQSEQDSTLISPWT